MNRFVATPLPTVFAFALVVTLAGALFAPSDVWPNLLIAGVFLSGLGLSGGFVVAIHDASGGNWLGPVRGIALSLTALVLPGSVIALAAIVLGGSMLYPAWHEPLHDGFKALWLDRTFFTVRAFAYVAAWLLSMQLLRRRRPAAWLVIFGVTVSFSTFDWLMSLDPHWASTFSQTFVSRRSDLYLVVDLMERQRAGSSCWWSSMSPSSASPRCSARVTPRNCSSFPRWQIQSMPSAPARSRHRGHDRIRRRVTGIAAIHEGTRIRHARDPHLGGRLDRAAGTARDAASESRGPLSGASRTRFLPTAASPQWGRGGRG